MRTQFINSCGPMQSKKRELKKMKKERENFEEASKWEKIHNKNKEKKVMRDIEYKAQRRCQLPIYYHLMKSGLTDKSITSAPKVIQC